jgi:hypothetical protein
VESSVADDPLGGGLEPGGREAGPLGVDEALERGRVIAEGEVVGEAGREVRVSEDVSRPAEENGGVRAREGCVEGSERDASAEARGGVRGDGRESGEERGEGGERDAAVAGEVVEDEVGVGGGQRRHRAGSSERAIVAPPSFCGSGLSSGFGFWAGPRSISTDSPRSSAR